MGSLSRRTSRSNVGRVRTNTVKKAAKFIIEKYYARLTLDFHTNKKICEEVAVIPSKRLRNKIAGFVTHLMKRIQTGSVRGISLKLLEEERERRVDTVPDKSAIDTEKIQIDKDTQDMLRSLNFPDMAGVEVVSETGYHNNHHNRNRKDHNDRNVRS